MARMPHKPGTYYAANRDKVLAKRSPCVDCGKQSWGDRCRPCRDVDVRSTAKGRDLEKRLELNRRRQARLREAPGLSQRQRYALLAKWKRQARQCTYCPAPATTVDHVIPVSLGGTNYEGNLAPACRSCNGQKNDSLLIEFRFKWVLAA